MKRRGFIAIQQGHTISTEGYEASMVRTGYESVIGMRSSEMFTKVAKMDGKVLEVNYKGITVEYKDGTKQGYPLGVLYGKAEGSVYPHTLVTDLKKGQTFKKDDYLSYNTGFFEKDKVLPGGIVYKGSLMARMALVELPQTHEDSSTISVALSERLRSTVTKVKTYTVNFQQNVLNVVKAGTAVSPETILMVIEDEITAMDASFGTGSLAILSERSKNAPRSGYVGKVSDIEVIYNGSLEDMTASLKSLAMASNRNKAREAQSRLKKATTGSTDSEFTVDGVPLQPGKAVIRVYINVSDSASLGDKIVVGNQLKSVIGEVLPYTMRTEAGDVVDGEMGARSFGARIVRSLPMMGERANVLHGTAKEAVKIYRA